MIHGDEYRITIDVSEIECPERRVELLRGFETEIDLAISNVATSYEEDDKINFYE